MQASATFSVSASPAELLEYLANPRNLLVGNHVGPVVEESELPVRAGSWFVLAFDQLRVRIEYTAFGPEQVAAALTYSGRGSGNLRGSFTYRLEPGVGSAGSRVTLDAESSGGWTPRPLSRLLWPVMWRKLRSRMEARSGPRDTPAR